MCVFRIFVSHVFYGKSGSCDGWNLFCDREIPGAGIWETVERLKVDGRMGWVGGWQGGHMGGGKRWIRNQN